MRALLMVFCLTLLTACSQGPASDTLQQDVQQRLHDAFPDSVLRLTELKRRGTANDANAPLGKSAWWSTSTPRSRWNRRKILVPGTPQAWPA